MTASTSILRRAPAMLYRRRMFSNSSDGSQQVPKDVAAPQEDLSSSKFKSDPKTQVEEVWYQSKRLPLYVTMFCTLGFAANFFLMRNTRHDVQFNPAKRASPIDTDEPDTKENSRMVSTVVKGIKGEDVNPHGMGVDPNEDKQHSHQKE